MNYLSNVYLLGLIAFFPILLSGVLLVGLRISAKYVMPVVYFITSLIAYFFEMSFNRILASTFQGLIITIGILWIIFGAIMLLNTPKIFWRYKRN